MEPFSKKSYQKKVEAIFTRFPSVQKVPFKDAYKPGLENMLKFEGVLGNPHKSLRTIHVAGTNGKGLCCEYARFGIVRLRSQSRPLHLSAHCGFPGADEDCREKTERRTGVRGICL